MNSTSNPPPQTPDPAREIPRRALVVRIGALGDVLLTRRLTYSLSLAGFRSTLFAPARHASVLLGDAWIERVLDSESPRFASVFGGEWPEAGRFDLAVVLSSSADLALAVRPVASEIIQFPPGPSRNDQLISRQWAEGVTSVGATFVGPLPRLETSATSPIPPGATVIHPGSGSPTKNWPMERFVELRRDLGARGRRVAWIRGPAEPALDGVDLRVEVIDRPTVHALAATLAGASLFIGNDSGVSHLAAAVGAPTLAIFGPTDPAVWAPDGTGVETLRSSDGDLAGITVERVIAATTRLRPRTR